MNLKPCPFCNSDVSIVKDYEIAQIRCRKCNYECDFYESWESAIKLWNTRPIEQSLSDELNTAQGTIEKLADSNVSLSDENERLKKALKESRDMYCELFHEFNPADDVPISNYDNKIRKILTPNPIQTKE